MARSIAISLLVFLCASTSYVEANSDDRASIEAVSLDFVGDPACTDYRKKIITQAWIDAVTMAKSVREKYNWDFGQPELEFFGPPAKSRVFRTGIESAIYEVGTWDQPYSFNPHPWVLQVRCDDWTAEKKCSPANGPTAFVHNSCPDLDGKHCITFCPKFFYGYKSLEAVLDRGLQLPDTDDTKWDLRKYANNHGTAFLHEMFHVDDIIKPSKLGLHISDLQVGLTSDSWVPAYGAMNTKLLARAKQWGYGPRKNADSYALFITAKYVSTIIGGYTYLPEVKRKKDPVDSDSIAEGEPTDKPCGDQECEPDSVEPIFEFNEDSEYPAEYLDPKNAFIEKFPENPPIPEPENVEEITDFKDTQLQCYHVPHSGKYQHPYVPREYGREKIEQACKLFHNIQMDFKDQQVVQMLYPIEGTAHNTLYIKAAWRIGVDSCKTESPQTIVEEECKTWLLTALDGCDTDTVETKHGGFKVENCMFWEVYVGGTGGYNPSIGKKVECRPRYDDPSQCDCSDSILRSANEDGSCPSPGFKKTKRGHRRFI